MNNMNLIENYNKYKEALNLIDNPYELKLGTVFSERIWKALKIPQKAIFMRILYNLFFDQYEICHNENQEKNNLVIWFDDDGFQKSRPDHREIFDNARYFIDEYHYVELKKIKNFTPWKIFKRINLIRKYKRSFQGICKGNLCLYMSSLICVVDDLYNLMQSSGIWNGKKNLLIFQDCDFASNTIVQLMKNKDIYTVELQHGQWLYRNEPYDDYLNIANFTADCILAWNEFTKTQFLKAGYDEKNICVAGSTKYVKEPETEALQKTKKQIFGVVLDTPVYSYSYSYNCKLLEIADHVAKNMGIAFYIKMHPYDSEENYKKFLLSENCLGCVERGMSMKAYAQMVDFSLAHTTSASVDLMILNAFVFLFRTEINNPIATKAFFEFKEETGLLESINDLMRHWEEYQQSYAEVRNIYRTENAAEKHKEFFDRHFNMEQTRESIC